MTATQTPIFAATTPPLGSSPPVRESSLLVYARAAWRSRWFIAALGLAGMVLGLLTSLGPTRYRASALFAPASGDAARSRLAGLAAQFGASLGSGDATSPGFYADLVQSRTVIARAVRTVVSDSSMRLSSDSLAALLGVEESSGPARDRATVEAIREAIRIELRRETGIVGVDLTLPDAVLAQRLLSATLASLNGFIIEMRQARASAERRFGEQQLRTAEQELRAAERRQLDFLEGNRGGLSSSPALALQRDRIMREVDMRQQVYTSLAQSYEQARVDEYRSTPLISIVEHPEQPLSPLPKRILQRLVAGLLVGVLLGVGIAVIAQFIREETGFAHELDNRVES